MNDTPQNQDQSAAVPPQQWNPISDRQNAEIARIEAKMEDQFQTLKEQTSLYLEADLDYAVQNVSADFQDALTNSLKPLIKRIQTLEDTTMSSIQHLGKRIVEQENRPAAQPTKLTQPQLAAIEQVPNCMKLMKQILEHLPFLKSINNQINELKTMLEEIAKWER